MEGLEAGRINIGARGVGVATAAFEAAIRYAQQRKTFGKPIAQHQAVQLMLADMATKIRAARLLVLDAAAQKDKGLRCDQEAGMAKLYASEICAQVTLDAMRIHGGYGYMKDLPLERYYRDAPLMIIGEGTNEIQKARHCQKLTSPIRSLRALGPKGHLASIKVGRHRTLRIGNREGQSYGGLYEDFEVGQVKKHWPGKTITESDNNLFCLLTRNDNPLHSDAQYMSEHQHGKILVNGALVFSLVVGMSVRDTSGQGYS